MDIAATLAHLDTLTGTPGGHQAAEQHLRSALSQAQREGDDGARLSLLGELMGLYRVTSRNDELPDLIDQSRELAAAPGLAGTQSAAVALTNAATALRSIGQHAAARECFHEALAVAEATMVATDRRLAALHNNLSMLYSQEGNLNRAHDELRTALSILRADPDRNPADADLAATYSNLALVEYDLGRDREATRHMAQSLDIYRATGDGGPHFASALASQAHAYFRAGRHRESIEHYGQALEILARTYGTTSEAYAITAGNLAEVRAAAGTSDTLDSAPGIQSHDVADPGADRIQIGAELSGLELARAYWHTHGRPLVHERYSAFSGRIAAGLIGHGSECHGFDDSTSRDHDFGPGFCLWLTEEDYATIGPALQADYDRLPATFAGIAPSPATARAQGAGRRRGVFAIGDFFESLTGHRDAPGPDRPHQWLMLDEATLACATNGAVFADPLGAFSAVRNRLTRMPHEVWLTLVSRRLGMAAQSGQYNVPRMLDRADTAAAWCAVAEFTSAIASLIFLLNRPQTVGYLPYYKWRFAALRRLQARMGTRLNGLVDMLDDVVTAASAVRLGDLTTPAGQSARHRLTTGIEDICTHIAADLRAQGLSGSTETFLEAQRAEVGSLITDPWLRST